MKLRNLTVLIAFAMAFAVAAHADSSKSSSKGKKSTKTTMTGCLQTGTSPNTYVLNTMGSSNMQSSQSRSGQTPSELARSESSFVLIPAGNRINFQNWVGQKVKVTGRYSSNAMSSSSSGETSSSSSSMSEHPEFAVSSIQKAAGTCR